jgi:hypothetical protein
VSEKDEVPGIAYEIINALEDTLRLIDMKRNVTFLLNDPVEPMDEWWKVILQLKIRVREYFGITDR